MPSAKPNETSSSNATSLYLIDVQGFIFRAYHALPPLTNSRGVPTGAVLGFCNMLFKLLEGFAPSHVAAVFDVGGKTFRSELYGEYKANRPPPPDDLLPQVPLVRQVVEHFRIATLAEPGVEADDVIATLVSRARRAAMPVTIVSSDKDLMQLAGDGVRLLDTMKDKVFGPAEVEEKFGVPPRLLGDWLALVGDASDNVPGVPGVGAKTATRLLVEHGGLEQVLGAVSGVRGKRLRENLDRYAHRARLARQLVALKEDCALPVTIDDLARGEIDQVALWRLFGELEFSRLRAKVVPSSVLDRSRYRTVLSRDALQQVVRAIRDAGEVAVDLETTSIDPVRAAIVGISLSWQQGEACYVPVGHRYLGAPAQLPLSEVLEVLGPLLADPALPKQLQNNKYDRIVLERAGAALEGVRWDSMLASYVLDPARNAHGLDELALDHLGHRMLKYRAVAGQQDDFDFVDVARATEYAAEDADATFRLAHLLGEQVEAEPELSRLLHEVEMPLSRVLAAMEVRGCGLDVDRLAVLGREVELQLGELLGWIREDAGWDINPNSPQQLQKLLFEQLELSTGRRTKTGFSTDADVLADLAIEHPIAARIDEWRTLAKLKSAYLDTLPTLVNPATGRVHTSYNQAVAATGRLSSSDPNLQNIPIRSDLGRRIREAFVPPPGRLLLSADYSQIELRVLAHLSQDPVLVDAFRKGQDVHARTAAEVFDIAPEQVSAEQRRVAKAVNFGVIYGQTDWGLARQLRIPKQQAARYIEGYFQRYAGVEAFMRATIDEARSSGVVRTLLGRRRRLADINSRRRGPRAYAERMARNTPIQGTAADLIKVAMIRVERALAQEGLDAAMILTVHDELVFEVLPGQQAEVAGVVTEVMSGVAELDVPLRIDTGVGDSWAAAH